MLEHVQARSRLGGWLLDTVQPIWTRLAGGCHPNRHTVELVEQSGFRIDPKACAAGDCSAASWRGPDEAPDQQQSAPESGNVTEGPVLGQ